MACTVVESWHTADDLEAVYINGTTADDARYYPAGDFITLHAPSGRIYRTRIDALAKAFDEVAPQGFIVVGKEHLRLESITSAGQCFLDDPHWRPTEALEVEAHKVAMAVRARRLFYLGTLLRIERPVPRPTSSDDEDDYDEDFANVGHWSRFALEALEESRHQIALRCYALYVAVNEDAGEVVRWLGQVGVIAAALTQTAPARGRTMAAGVQAWLVRLLRTRSYLVSSLVLRHAILCPGHRDVFAAILENSRRLDHTAAAARWPQHPHPVPAKSYVDEQTLLLLDLAHAAGGAPPLEMVGHCRKWASVLFGFYVDSDLARLVLRKETSQLAALLDLARLALVWNDVPFMESIVMFAMMTRALTGCSTVLDEMCSMTVSDPMRILLHRWRLDSTEAGQDDGQLHPNPQRASSPCEHPDEHA
jgi:hypothetical protein